MQIKWYALTYVVFIYILFIQKWKLLELTVRTLECRINICEFPLNLQF